MQLKNMTIIIRHRRVSTWHRRLGFKRFQYFTDIEETIEDKPVSGSDIINDVKDPTGDHEELDSMAENNIYAGLWSKLESYFKIDELRSCMYVLLQRPYTSRGPNSRRQPPPNKTNPTDYRKCQQWTGVREVRNSI